MDRRSFLKLIGVSIVAPSLSVTTIALVPVLSEYRMTTFQKQMANARGIVKVRKHGSFIGRQATWIIYDEFGYFNLENKDSSHDSN